MVSILKEVGLSGVIDIFLMSILIYVVLIWFKKKRAAVVVAGILISGLIYLVAHQFNLFLVSSVLRAFFAVFLIAVIIIFQEEIKYFFEQIAVWSLERRIRSVHGIDKLTPRREVEILVRTVRSLARDKIGALIVIKGKVVIQRHLDGGVELDGMFSEPLLKSLFDPHSDGHDGAVVIDEDRVLQFGVHLPLSKNFEKIQGGTRHAAALGLAERTDALCLVVSEEKGSISVASNGDLAEVPEAGQLSEILESFYSQVYSRQKRNLWREIFRTNYREKITAFLLTLSLWFVLVHESKLIQNSFSIPIEYPKLNSELLLREIDPKEVTVTFSGPRSSFHFMNPKDIRLSLKLSDIREGTRRILLSESNITYPKKLTFERIDPRQIIMTIEKEKKEQ